MKADCFKLLLIMEKASKRKARLWGDSIVGFGEYHYQYASGHKGIWMLTGFSPRKRKLVIYVMPGFSAYAELMRDLGKYTTGKSCLYINRLDDVNCKLLKQLIVRSVHHMEVNYQCR